MLKKLYKGFTLVELLVVLILMGLITTAIAMVLRPTTNLYIDVNNKTNEEVAAITLFDVINGKLRYATNVYIVSNNDDTTVPTIPTGLNLKHYIMFSNKKRPGDHLGAHGYVKYGEAAHALANARYVGNSDSLFENADVKFSIQSFSSESGKEAITINALMHPMSSKGMLTNKEYQYNETFKFLNLQRKAQLSQIDWTNRKLLFTMYDSDAVNLGIDSLMSDPINTSTDGEQVFWIFYENPEDAAAGISTSVYSADPNFKEFTVDRGDKYVDLGAVSTSYTIVFQPGAGGSGNDPNVLLPSTVHYYDDGGNQQTGKKQLTPNTPIELSFEEGSDDEIQIREATDVKATVKFSDFAAEGTNTLYLVRDDTGHWTVTKDGQEDNSDNKDIRVHYIRTDGDGWGFFAVAYDPDSVGHGVTVDGTELNAESSDSYVKNADEVPLYSERVFTIHLSEKDTGVLGIIGTDSNLIPNIFRYRFDNYSSSDYYLYLDGTSLVITDDMSSIPESVKNMSSSIESYGKIHLISYGGSDDTQYSMNYYNGVDVTGYVSVPKYKDSFELIVNFDNASNGGFTFNYNGGQVSSSQNDLLRQPDQYHYFFNGVHYDNPDDAQAAAEEFAAAEAAKKSVTIHYNSADDKQADFGTGEKTAGYTAGLDDEGAGKQNWQKTTGDTTISIGEGHQLVIKIQGGWNAQYGSDFVYTYEDIVSKCGSGNSCELWIQGGTISDTKPSDW